MESQETSCSLDCSRLGPSLECEWLATRVLISLGVCHQASEATSSRFYYLGPFLQSEPPKAPSGLLTASHPCLGHLHTDIQHSPPHGSWGTCHVPGLEGRVEFRSLFFLTSSLSWKSLVPLRASPVFPLCNGDNARDHILGTSLGVGETTPMIPVDWHHLSLMHKLRVGGVGRSIKHHSEWARGPAM